MNKLLVIPLANVLLQNCQLPRKIVYLQKNINFKLKNCEEKFKRSKNLCKENIKVYIKKINLIKN